MKKVGIQSNICSYVLPTMARVTRISLENRSRKWSNTSWAPQQVAWNEAYAGELRWPSCGEVRAKAVGDRPEQLTRRGQQTGGGGRGQAAAGARRRRGETTASGGGSDLWMFDLRATSAWAWVGEEEDMHGRLGLSGPTQTTPKFRLHLRHHEQRGQNASDHWARFFPNPDIFRPKRPTAIYLRRAR
jgi:hypothetical protein